MPRTVWLYCRSFEKSISRPKLPLCFTSECVNSWNTSKSHMTLYKQKDSTLPPARYDVLRAANGLILLSREVLGPTLVESIVCVRNSSLPAFFLLLFPPMLGPLVLSLGLQHCTGPSALHWAFSTVVGPSALHWAFSIVVGPSALHWAFSTALGLQHCRWAFSIVVGPSALHWAFGTVSGPSTLH